MKLFTAIAFGLATLLLTSVFVYTRLTASNLSETPSRLCFGERCVTLEIARTPEERRQGLMYRTALAAETGMLFIFEQPGYHSFWMKNTLIPLDILWLDENLTVVHIERNVPPCATDPCPSYRPPVEARYVLEVNAGAAEGIGVGDAAKARQNEYE